MDAYAPCVTFNEDNLRFSSSCIHKLDGKEYIEILIHPIKKLLIVRSCEKEHKNAIRWTSYSNGKAFGRDIACTAYIHTLYALLDWKPSTKYRLCCTLLKAGKETIVIFDAKNAKAIIPKNDPTIPITVPSQSFYAYKCNQNVPPSRKAGKISMYNPLPDLNPTTESILHDSIQKIAEELRGINNGA